MGDEKLHSIEEESMSNGCDSDDLGLGKLNLAKDFNEGPTYGNLNESRMLEIMSRMNRVVMILKVPLYVLIQYSRYYFKTLKQLD